MVNEAIFTLITVIAVSGVMIFARFIAKRIPHGEARFDANRNLVSCHTCGRVLNVESDPMSIDCGGDCWGCTGAAELGGNLDSKVRAEIAAGRRNSEGYPVDGYY